LPWRRSFWSAGGSPSLFLLQLSSHGRKWPAPPGHYFFRRHTAKRRHNRCSPRRCSLGNRHHHPFHCSRNQRRNSHDSGSGFQSVTTLAINGKAASVTFKESNTLLVVTPARTLGPQQITLTNPDGETVSLDAALFAN
jgi:hypothetical protein